MPIDPKSPTTMKLAIAVLVALAVVLLVWALTRPAAAQTATSTSTSGSSATVDVQSGATASSQGGSVYIAGSPAQTRNRSTVDYQGDYTVRSAPSTSAPAFGSGHPCALAGSIGISIIGGSASGGKMVVDQACLLAAMGERGAALLMIAERDPAACRALRNAGRIPRASLCTNAEKRAAADRRTAAPVAAPAAPRCIYDGRGRLIRVTKPTAAMSDTVAIAACTR